MEKEKFIKELKNKLNIIGVNLNEEQLNTLYKYKEMILEWNQKVNLTAIIEDEDFINKHLVDSLTVNKYINIGKMIDIGTGAGFPGIPINIANNNNIVLFDSLSKRLKILDEIINKLHLSNISTLHGRAEEIFKNKIHREKYDIATSRAVANLNVLAELMLPAVKVGGICICMKGSEVSEELKQAKNAIKKLGGEIEKIETFNLPNTEIKRNIIIMRKVNSTPSLYPRKPGTPQKQPIA